MRRWTWGLLLLAGCEERPPAPPAPPAVAPPAPAAAAPPARPAFTPQDFVGAWKAKVLGARLTRAGRSLDVPAGEAGDFEFSIARRGEEFVLDGPSALALKSEDRTLAGEHKGVRVRLTWIASGLAGELARKASDSDSTLVLEFEAERVR